MAYACEFCGQALALTTDDPEEAQLYARETCDCLGAARWRKLQKANIAVDDLIDADSAVAAVLRKLCEWCIDDVMAGVSLTIGWGETVKIKRNGKGELVIIRKSSQEQQVTV